jgi:hypothetical protein
MSSYMRMHSFSGDRVPTIFVKLGVVVVFTLPVLMKTFDPIARP